MDNDMGVMEFRGKRIDNGEWVEGELTTEKRPNYEDNYLAIKRGVLYEVDPKTVVKITELMNRKNINILYAVIPDLVRFDVGENEPVAYFKHKKHADKFALNMYGRFYIIKCLINQDNLNEMSELGIRKEHKP